MNVYTSTHESDHIKRPLNSFMVWAKEKRRVMNKNNPKMRNADISKILGEEWRQMPEKDKQPYVQQAVYLRRQHKIDYPNYRYRPRRKNSQDPRTEVFDRTAPYSRVFSNVFLPLPSSSSPLRGACVPYSYDSYIPPRYSVERLEAPPHGISFQPKFIPPYSPSYVLPSNDIKEYNSSSSPCLSELTIKDGPLKSTSARAVSTYSPTVSYMMLPSKNQYWRKSFQGHY